MVHQILLTIMILSFGFYLFIINRHNEKLTPFKALKSVSAGFYMLPTVLRFLCLLCYVGFVVPAMLITTHWVIFLAGMSILFTAVAAAYRENKLSMDVYVYSANIGIGLSQLYILFDIPRLEEISHIPLTFNHETWWLAVIFVIITLILLKIKEPTRVYWIEILALALLVIKIH